MPNLEKLYSKVPVVRCKELAASGLETMRRSGARSLPVVDSHDHYVGMLDFDSTNGADGQTTCADVMTPRPPVSAAFPLATALAELGSRKEASVAVTDNYGNVEGTISAANAMLWAAHELGAGEPGSTVCVNVGSAGYSMSRVADIIEQTGASILSMTTRRSHEGVDIIVKTTAEDPVAITDSLGRYGYDCSAALGPNASGPSQQNVIRQNYDSLMAYLDM